MEVLQVNVADVAATGLSRARARMQRCFESRIVNITDHFSDEMTASYVPIAINTEDGVSGVAISPEAFVVAIIQRKQWIKSSEKRDFVGVGVCRVALKGVHPYIDTAFE